MCDLWLHTIRRPSNNNPSAVIAKQKHHGAPYICITPSFHVGDESLAVHSNNEQEKCQHKVETSELANFLASLEGLKDRKEETKETNTTPCAGLCTTVPT
jgi:hypothetical protein